MSNGNWTRPVTVCRTGALLLTSIGLCACEAFVGAGPAAPYKTDDPTAGTPASAPAQAGKPASAAAPAKPGAGTWAAGGAGGTRAASMAQAMMAMPAPAMMSACDAAPARALALLTTYCAGCHGDPATAKGGFGTVLDASALVMSGKVIQGKPQQSPLYLRASSGSMPPADVKKRPAAADLAALEAWISCGARDWSTTAPTQAFAFVSIDARLGAVLDDLRAIPNPVDRERMRYIDLSTLANGGDGQDAIEVYRDAVSMLLNSLSRGRSVVAPVAVDADKLIYRLDLRDYLWDSASWTQLEAQYPYAVIYDQDSRLFPADEVSAEQIRLETKTQIPVIQADWFISHASRPPLYYSLLDLPASLQGLEQQLGVNIQRDIDTEQVLRSGFADAGPSQNNRVIERHELGGNRGALWLSYDFSSNVDVKNVFSHPLDFQQDGGEMIFNLDNGLQGYFIANAAGVRLDKAPSNVVQDPASRDGAVEAGLSCMTCHQLDGQLPKFDEIRDFQLNAGASAQQIERVLAVYVPRPMLQSAFDSDQNRYRSARAALGVDQLSNTSMHQLDNQHQGVLDIDDVAAVLGLPGSELKRAIDASPQAFPPEIVTLRTQAGSIQRDAFETIVSDLIQALGLGQQLRVDGQGRRAGSNTPRNVAGAAAGGSGGQSAAGSGSAGSGGSSSRRR